MICHFNHALAKTSKSLISCPSISAHKILVLDPSNRFWLLLLTSCWLLLLEKPSHAKECCYHFIVPSLRAIQQALFGSSSSLPAHICNSRHGPLSKTPLPTTGPLLRWGFMITQCKFCQLLVSYLEISICSAPALLAPVNLIPSRSLQDIEPLVTPLWPHLGINVSKSLLSWKISPLTFHFPLEVTCHLLLNGMKGPALVGDCTF